MNPSSKSKLGSLFGGDDDEGTGGALKYQAPKDPSRARLAAARPASAHAPAQTSIDGFVPSASFAGPRPGFAFQAGPQGIGYYKEAPAAAAPAAAPAPAAAASPPQAAGASAIVYSTQLRLFVFDRATNAYAAAGGGGLCGCVVVGGGTNYTLLVYDAQKQHLCACVLDGAFTLAVQPNLYVSFTSPSGEAWSVHLASAAQLEGFCKHVVATCAHVAQHSGAPLAATCLQVGATEDAATAGAGDTCGVVYAAWDLPTSPNANPVAGLALAPASDNGGEMAKLKAGDAKGEPVPGLAAALLGMPLKATRFLVVPSLDLPWRFVSIDLVKHKKKTKEASAEVPVPPALPLPPAAAPALPVVEPADLRASLDESAAALRERMARVAKAGGALFVPAALGSGGAAHATPDAAPSGAAPEAPPEAAVPPLVAAAAALTPSPMSAETTLATVPGAEARSHFATAAPPPLPAPLPPPASSHNEGPWAALVLQQQQQAQATLLGLQGSLGAVAAKCDRIDAAMAAAASERQAAAVAESQKQLQQMQLQLMQQSMGYHSPMGMHGFGAGSAMGQGYSQQHQMQQQQQMQMPQQQPPPYMQQQPQPPPPPALPAALAPSDIDADAVSVLVAQLVADHTRLRGRAAGEETAALAAKVDDLTAKVAKLMDEKMALLEQAHATHSGQGQVEKQRAALEASLAAATEAAAQQRDAHASALAAAHAQAADATASALAAAAEEAALAAAAAAGECAASVAKAAAAATAAATAEAAAALAEAAAQWEASLAAATAAAAQTAAAADEAALGAVQEAVAAAAAEAAAAAAAAAAEKERLLEQLAAAEAAASAAAAAASGAQASLSKQLKDAEAALASAQTAVPTATSGASEEEFAASKTEAAAATAEATAAKTEAAAAKTEAAAATAAAAAAKTEAAAAKTEAAAATAAAAAATERAASAEAAAAAGGSGPVPIKGIMEDIYTLLYATLQLGGEGATSTFTAKQVNKGIRETLKQVASKYSTE